jgi:Na+/melibiose symporter-like transporter
MAKRKITRKADALTLIQIACTVLLILMGIQAIVYYDSTAGEVSRFFQRAVGRNDYAVNITMGIVTIVCGGILGLTVLMKIPFRSQLVLGAAVLWIAMALYVLFIRANAFEQNALAGFSELFQRGMIALILWSAR